jgi:hypothetical protein
MTPSGRGMLLLRRGQGAPGSKTSPSASRASAFFGGVTAPSRSSGGGGVDDRPGVQRRRQPILGRNEGPVSGMTGNRAEGVSRHRMGWSINRQPGK